VIYLFKLETNVKILIVLSSCGQIPGTDRKTGTWFEELAAPYYTFQDAGAEVTLVSVSGGPAPIDPASEGEGARTDATRRFADDPAAKQALANTRKLSVIRADDYDAVFYSGGLGPVFDLTDDKSSIALIEATHRAGKPVAAVCHGVAALRLAKTPEGAPLIRGRSVAGFSNSEERAAHGVDVVPFLIEDELRRLGGHYSSAADWNGHVVVDGQLITGQNPASSGAAAQKVLEALQ
jgi:putative intracellular protease/amidase